MRKMKYESGKLGMAYLGAANVLEIVVSCIREVGHFQIVSIGRRRMIGNR